MDSFQAMNPTAFIVEDEPQARELIRALLTKRHPRVRLVGEAGDVHTAADAIRDTAPQLRFLDVDLGGPDGFDLLRRLAPVEPLVIFTTGKAEHAVQAFDVRAVDFLVNRKHIQCFIKGEGGEVIMSDGANLPVSRRQKADLMEALERI